MQLTCPNCNSAVELLDTAVPGGQSTLDAAADLVAAATCPNCHSRLNVVGPAKSTERLPARNIGQYELIEKVGEGQSAVVWKAKDTKLNRIVALKIPRTFEIMEQGSELFLREAQAIARLNHPNIVKLYAAETTDDMLMVVTEYIEGMTLQDHLRTTRLPHRESARICQQLADALQHAHGNGVVHRDMKPGNVLIDPQGQMKITDFGLAKRDAADITMTLDGQILGTPAYMSPEQAQGKNASTDKRSDVYSLGVMFYEMLAGRLPFDGNSRVILDKVINGDVKSPRRIDHTIPRELEAICLKAMSTDPARRFQTAGEFAADVARFLEGKPIQTRPASTFEVAWKWARRHPWQLTTAVSLLVAAFTLIASVQAQARSGPVTPKIPLRKVRIETDPPNAFIACYRLDQKTGEPLLETLETAESKPKAELSLQVGRYLFVAVLPNGRFHEVYRRVPPPGTFYGLHFAHEYSVERNGVVELPSIDIPPLDVAQGMAKFDGSDHFIMGEQGSLELPPFECSLPGFYLDTHETTNREFTQIRKHGPALWDVGENQKRPANDALSTIMFDEAAAYAEERGKRLMTEVEYEYAATLCGTRKFPWGDSPLPSEWPIGEIGKSELDVLPTNPPVVGLASNVGEFTSTWGIYYPAAPQPESLGTEDLRRIVRGAPSGIGEGRDRIIPKDWTPKERYTIERVFFTRNVGIRLARSVRPRIRPDLFYRIVRADASKPVQP